MGEVYIAIFQWYYVFDMSLLGNVVGSPFSDIGSCSVDANKLVC